MQYFDPKDPGESLVLTYDFTLGIPSGKTLSGTPTVAITVRAGTDANASAVLAGGNSLNSASTQVYVPVAGGVNGVDYEIKVTIATTDTHTTLVLSGVLPVRAA
ncbi:MAG: hypothetical protein KGL39_31090 [Patescibacteria group bacterium]|nr:hypothetical protein [Patescibacteria group bacterium]